MYATELSLISTNSELDLLNLNPSSVIPSYVTLEILLNLAVCLNVLIYEIWGLVGRTS